jgi:large subunit ribosomal protein L1
MGKVKPRLLGNEEIEEKQKKEQKAKSMEKKMLKKKSKSVDETVLPAKPVLKEAGEKKEKTPKSPKSPKVISIKPRGKRYQEAKKMVDINKNYSLKEAIGLLKKMKLVKFDQSVELHFVVDETGLKGEIDLPFTTGKIVRVKVVDDKILADLEKGKIEFDVLVTHPSFMPRLAKFAKVLGPKGLMPNPKAGTVSMKPEEVVKKFEKGLLRWKTEAKFPLIHQMVGKISFDEKNLIANSEKFIEAVGKTHIKKGYIKTTMSPAIKLEIQ